MSKYIYLNFLDLIAVTEDARIRIKSYVYNIGMNYIYNKHKLGNNGGFIGFELKQEIEVLNQFSVYSIQVMDVLAEGLLLYGVLQSEGDVMIYLPFSNISCVTSHFRKDSRTDIINYDLSESKIKSKQ